MVVQLVFLPQREFVNLKAELRRNDARSYSEPCLSNFAVFFKAMTSFFRIQKLYGSMSSSKRIAILSEERLIHNLLKFLCEQGTLPV